MSLIAIYTNRTIAQRRASDSRPARRSLCCLPREVGFYEKSDELLYSTSKQEGHFSADVNSALASKVSCNKNVK